MVLKIIIYKNILQILICLIMVAALEYSSKGQSSFSSDLDLYRYPANIYPNHGMPEWGNNEWAANGIAHDSLNWYFSSVNRSRWLGAATHPTDWKLWRVPVKYDIGKFSPNAPGVKVWQFSEAVKTIAALRNYSHIGDIDYCTHKRKGYIVAPLTGNGAPRIAFFLAATLTYLNYAILKQKDVGWCAVSPDGYLYTSNDSADVFFKYRIRWDTVLNLINNRVLRTGLIMVDSFTLHNSAGNPEILRNMQGGAFTPDNDLLYVNCGVNACMGRGEYNEEDGIHVFETSDWKEVMHSSNSKRDKNISSTFDFPFDNSDCNDEPEGIDIWDLDHFNSDHPQNVLGYLHVILTNHNKYMIVRNICEAGKYLNPLYVPYKSVTSVTSFFKGHKVHASKVSVYHFGPYSYDGDKNGGYIVSDEEKKEEALLEECYKILLTGDTLKMVKYLADHLDDNGNIAVTPANPSVARPIYVYPDKSQKIIPDKGHWKMPTVTVGTRNCSNLFGMGISETATGISIRKGRIGKDCNLVNNESEIFSYPISGRLIPEGINFLDYIPVLLPSNNNYLDPSSPFPFSVYNYWTDWIWQGDSYFNFTISDINYWGSCKSNNGIGHSKYSYFLGPDNDFSCGRFREFMNNRNNNPALLSSIETKYPLFRFAFFIPLTDGIYITDASGKLVSLPQVNLEWLRGMSNTNTEVFQRFFYNLAVIAAADPHFTFLEKPQLYDKPRAIITGHVNGRSYIAGVDDSGIYSPIDCDNGEETSKLIDLLIANGYENSPLKPICAAYMQNESDRDVIKAFLPANIGVSGNDPGNDIKRVNLIMDNVASITGDINFLIEKSNGDYNVYNLNSGNQTSADWYRRVAQFGSKNLMELAILNQEIECFAIDNSDTKVGIVGYDFDDVFLFCNNEGKIMQITDYESGNPTSKNYFIRSKEDYYEEQRRFNESYLPFINKCQ